jgi:MFS family permease
MRLRQYDALALTAAIWFLGKFLRYAFPPLFGPLQETYAVSNTVIGTAYGALMIAYAGMQFPSGALSDYLGPVRVITVGALVAAVGALSIVLPGSLALLVGGMVLIGLGSGAHKTVAVPMLSSIYRRRPGRALGIMDTLGAFGGVVAPPAVVLMLETPGWRYVFVAGGLVGLALAFGFHRRVPERLPDSEDVLDDGSTAADGGPEEADSGSEADADPSTLSVYRTLFRDHVLLVVVLATVLSSFAFNGAVAFLPLYLTDSAGLSTAFASAVYSGFFLVSLVQLGTGEVGDRVGMLPVLSGALALATVGLVGVVLAGTPFVLAAAVLVFGVGVHGHRPVRGAYFAALLPDTIRGGALGVIRTALIGAGAAAPVIVGYLTDAFGYYEAFVVIAATMAIASGLVVALMLGSGIRRFVPA